MRIERMIDANLNRVSEGLRVIEDILRFVYEQPVLQAEIRELKHGVRKGVPANLYMRGRNAQDDVGIEVSVATSLDQKNSLQDLITANFKRVQEGLRTIEESLKIIGQYDVSKVYESLRFKAYVLEQKCNGLSALPDVDLYGILCEPLSGGRSNVEVAEKLASAGVQVIQYRSKEKAKAIRLEECRKIRAITQKYKCFFIVNDDLDIALSVRADGLHLGQDDMPFTEARQLAPHLTIGVSTHRPEQALMAVEQGADYIGVGPVYATQTKKNVEGSDGLDYVQWVSENIAIPFVTIGGIKQKNVREVQKRGATCFAMISELVAADNVAATVSDIRSILKRNP